MTFNTVNGPEVMSTVLAVLLLAICITMIVMAIREDLAGEED